MTARITRRMALAGLMASAATAASADALRVSPLPRPRPERGAAFDSAAEALIREANLGGRVTFALADAKTGDILAAKNPDALLPPASTAKAVTAYYALETLGPEFRFETTLMSTGPIVNGQLEGDLVLVGSGDPLLDSDDLGALAAEMKAAGIVGVNGRFLIWDGHLPNVPRIANGQPDTAGYNPTITGVNLNFNRVHFEWKRARSDYEITMQARAQKFRPSVTISTMDVVEERMPVYTYRDDGRRDRWTVARSALGAEGARWLPVRRPVQYAGEVFQSIARSYGIVLKPAERADARPEGYVIARHLSSPLPDVLRGMLRYSTNLTAEVVGLHARAAEAAMPRTLYGSAAGMNNWAAQKFGARDARLVDHSGLGYASRMTAEDMVSILRGAAGDNRLHALLRPVRLGEVSHGGSANAKTGTHNFVSALAGYLDLRSDQRLVFAIFCADADRRDAIPPELRERPSGSRSYAQRARTLQRNLLNLWASRTVS